MSSPTLSDRGFQFGDGLFETIRVDHGELQQFELHWQRLKRGAAVLGIRMPARRILEMRCKSLAKPSLPEDESNSATLPAVAALKLQVTRGNSIGGYAAPETAPANIYVFIRPVGINQSFWQQGVRVRWCQQTLAIQPVLAGIKHCNRLEQVLARREWQNDYQEGLMCDTEGYVVEGTATNVFACVDGEWKTPLLDRCGVIGTMRQQVMDWFANNAIAVSECRLTREALMSAEHVLLSNAIIGVWPVAELGGEQKQLAPIADKLVEAFSPTVDQNKNDITG